MSERENLDVGYHKEQAAKFLRLAFNGETQVDHARLYLDASIAHTRLAELLSRTEEPPF